MLLPVRPKRSSSGAPRGVPRIVRTAANAVVATTFPSPSGAVDGHAWRGVYDGLSRLGIGRRGRDVELGAESPHAHPIARASRRPIEPARRQRRPVTELLRLEVALEDEDDRRILRGALLAARATELSELQRRAGRLSFGYGSETARESMDAETRKLRRRIDLLDSLIGAIDRAVAGPATEESD